MLMEFKARTRTRCITFLFQQMPSVTDLSNISLHRMVFSIYSSRDRSHEWHALLRSEVQVSSFLSLIHESAVGSRDNTPR
jgi:hypothetical protein